MSAVTPGRSALDPETQVPRLVRVADWVLAGEVVLPRFQRDFVWSRQQILDLLDSVVRNYPIGSVLLWQSTEELAAQRTVAGLAVEKRRYGYPARYIIDGQQRIATICGSLYWQPDGDPESRWNIVYDLEGELFRHRADLDEPPEHQIPMRLFQDAAVYFQRLASVASPELRERGKLLYNRLMNYQIAVITLQDITSDEVAKVFERINSTATPLTVVDLMRAATWSPDFDLREEIDRLLGVLDEKKYGRVDRKTILRTISAAAGFGFSRSDIGRLRELPEEDLRAAVNAAGEAAKRAVDFLTTQIHTPRAEALPYYNQFALLVEIFRQLPKPSAAHYAAVHRWFWLTASGGYFKGWSETQMATDWQAIADFSAGATSDIDVAAAAPRSALWRRSSFRSTSAPSKLLALILSYAEPLDLRSGQRIDVGRALSWQNDKEFHHFFPRAFLQRSGISSAQANVCANLMMLSSVTNIWVSDRPPSVYLRDLCETDGEAAIRQRLDTCLVNDVAFAAALADDYDGFLAARSELIHGRLMTLIGAEQGAIHATVPLIGALDQESDPYEPVDRDSAD